MNNCEQCGKSTFNEKDCWSCIPEFIDYDPRYEEFSMKTFGCSTIELSRRAAADTIVLLRNKMDAPILAKYPNE